MDGWMDCNFTSFSTVFQSYQDNEKLIMKGCVQRNPFYDWLVGCFGLNGPVRQYFSLYRAASQRKGERKEQ